MKRTAFFALIVYYIAVSDSRLLKKVTKTGENERKPSNVSSTSATPPVRLRRYLAIENSFDSMSKEEQPESLITHERRNRYYIKDKKRVQRHSNDTTLDTTKFIAVKENKVLVKKPIPKYTELDEYELEPKHYRLLPRFVETDENEDEDFNLDDYDFDIKHDEFIGRGKPIIPRMKDKEKIKNTEAPPVSKYIAPTIPPIEQEPMKNKSKPNRQRSVNMESIKLIESREDVYDYEISTIKTTEKDENGSNEDIDDSKEVNRPVTRHVRSPWHKIMLPQRLTIRSSAPSKRMSVLPMFPGAAQRRPRI